MATHDHTARARLPVPAGSTHTLPPDTLTGSASALPPELVFTREDLALAAYALTRLRIDHEQCLHARTQGFPHKSLEWPLSASVAIAVATAIQCLERLVDGSGEALRVNA
ncbi:hypothetical protein [Dyella silvae]|uniref:hypothetical protein n=1 Tax=Dyella silvae TaxID=2994424 RepID=UPI00226525C9|nr:hypothetical protein [Dyella silvae]